MAKHKYFPLANKEPVKPKRGRPPKEKNKAKTDKTMIMGINKDRFIKLLKKKSGKDELYAMADELQARMAFSNLAIIERVEQSMTDYSETTPLDEQTKAANAIKGAMAAINDSFKALGITVSGREEPEISDEALQILLSERSEMNVPPELEVEFFSAKEDMEQMSDPTYTAGDNKKEMLDEIKKPIRVGIDSRVKEKVQVPINVEEVGVGELK